MTSPTTPVFGTHDHPAGQIAVPARRRLVRSLALAGYRSDDLQARNTIVGLIGMAGMAVNSVTDSLVA